MTQNNNFSPLPWYKTKEEWNSRKSYAYGNIYPLFAPASTLLPFQLEVEEGAAVRSLQLWKDGTVLAELYDYPVVTASLQAYPSPADESRSVLLFPGTTRMPVAIGDGLCHLELLMDKGGILERYYSEQFTVVQDITPYLTVEWWDDTDLVFDAGCVLYRQGYRNRLHFIAELGKPGYEYEEEGEERDGYFFAEKRLSWKTYRFTVLAPEYLCDVMRFIPLADHVRITDKYDRAYLCDTFGTEVDWQEQGDLAAVSAEFTTDTAVKKIPTCGSAATGDFNADFSADFNTGI